MTAPVSSIRNLGPASDAAFARAGITTADQVRDLGADAAYESLLRHGTRPHFIGYYALVMGLQGRPWNDCQGREKTDLRKRFDTIRARAAASGVEGPSSRLSAELDRIGVRRTP
ncbi:MAG: competence protein TfoX [Boseongicola sp.]|nr:competence protein TfoX [Boseongicola sp.]